MPQLVTVGALYDRPGGEAVKELDWNAVTAVRILEVADTHG